MSGPSVAPDVEVEISEDVKEGEFSTKAEEDKVCTPSQHRDIADRSLSWAEVIVLVVAALLFFWIFLIGLTLMGSAFKVLGGAGAAKLFTAISDPISGLMVGVLATVLVQSSSTSTSVVVAMVSSDIIAVKTAIPIVMGANIGTTVTNTIVSMGFVGNRIELQRAFAAATVHDMFNFLAVVVLLPIEAIIGEIQGRGGPLFWFTEAIADVALSGQKSGKLFKSPVKTLTSFVADAIVKTNKYVIYGRALPRPENLAPMKLCQSCRPIAGIAQMNCTLEEGSRRLSSLSGELYIRSAFAKRRLEELGERAECGEYACVPSKLAGYFKKANKKAFAEIQECDQFIRGFTCPSDKDLCVIQGAQYYDDHIANGALISGGLLKDVGDVGGGVLGVIISLLLLSGGLLGLTKCLTKVFMTKAKRIIGVAMKMNGYIGILVGLGITLIVQSSSVCTSALTPLAAIGVLPLVKMFPMTLGSNIGTTTTALIASLVDLKKAGVQIALCHFCFNCIGIAIWFPAPKMRKVPLEAAKVLGLYSAQYRVTPLIYILTCFLAVPAVAFGVMKAFKASVGLGVVFLVLFIAVLTVWTVWWNFGIPLGKPGCYRVMTKEDREKNYKDMLEDNARIMGVTPEEYLVTTRPLWTG